ncbi:MAG: DUF362 domain-containing protein, partial [Chloroflexi bacterium]|nr:DUF362 domain-containing protein [Chloroflexota bacterium]
MMWTSPDVALIDVGATEYPAAPFHPSEPYPEYPFGAAQAAGDNPVYRGVREMLRQLGLDREHFGTPAWNPLGGLVKPGGTVLIKPNLVISDHPLGQRGIEASVAHGAVLRPFIDYAMIALGGRGRIVVGDSPIKEVDFPRILQLNGTQSVLDFYAGRAALRVETLDFRDRWVKRNADHFMTDMTPLPGDPTGYTMVDVGTASLFEEISDDWNKYRSTAVYYENVMVDFHRPGKHLYSMPNTLLNADLVIFVAKLKTHRKGGVTLCLKNAVGTTNEKRALPHHRVGSPKHGGDAVSDNARPDARLEDTFRDVMLGHPYGRAALKLVGTPLRRYARPALRKLMDMVSSGPAEAAIVEGDWFGNDTVWRMAHDLNLAFLFGDRQGKMQDTPQRNYLGVVDGVMAGDGEGPLYPDPAPAGVLLGGWHPVWVDLVGATAMGYDWRKIPMIREAFRRPGRLQPGAGPEAV